MPKFMTSLNFPDVGHWLICAFLPHIGQGRTCIVQIRNYVPGLVAESLHVANGHSFRRDRTAHYQIERTGLDVPSAHRQRFIGTYQGHGHNIYLRLNCQEESSSHELHQVSALGSPTFGKYYDGHVVLQGFDTAMEAAQRHAHVGSVYGNLTGPAQVPTHEGISK